VTLKPVDHVKAPDVESKSTRASPRVAVALAVNVITLIPVVGFGAKETVTPLGGGVSLCTLKVTLPVNPLIGVTVAIDVAEAPWSTSTL